MDLEDQIAKNNHGEVRVILIALLGLLAFVAVTVGIAVSAVGPATDHAAPLPAAEIEAPAPAD